MHTDMPVIENVERRSLREESWREANAERWILGQKAGCDPGDQALRQWVRQHWRGFLRARWVEHMLGVRFWVELDRNEFGLLHRNDLLNARELLVEIIEMLRRGAENLDIICWACRSKSDADQATIRELLTLININAHRLPCPFGND